jgi:bacterioferritin (cytochrome b1)
MIDTNKIQSEELKLLAQSLNEQEEKIKSLEKKLEELTVKIG